MNAFTFDNLLENPKEVISPLSEKQIKKLLIDAINEYFDKKIDLENLIEISKLIKQYSSFPIGKFGSDLDEIISFSFVKEILNDISQELNSQI